MSAPVLVIGASGETGSKVAEGLAARGERVRAASRRTGAATETAPGSVDERYTSPEAVVFDWYDPATHAAALDDVERMYLIAPIGDPDPAPVVRPVLELGLRMGLERVVLLSSSAVEPSDHGLGALHRLVTDLVPQWAVLRPSWFMQNFTGDRLQALALRAGLVRSATGAGRIGFVDTRDIADVAVELLTREEPVRDEYVLTGPEALSYADVCALAGDLTGRRIVHEPVTVDEVTTALRHAGVPAGFAPVLAALDRDISQGSEDRTTDAVEQVTGRPPRSLADLLSSRSPNP